MLNNVTVPPPPGVSLPTAGESSDDPYNHYDWIPADRNSKGDNDYDEINLQGARMLAAARARRASNNGNCYLHATTTHKCNNVQVVSLGYTSRFESQ